MSVVADLFVRLTLSSVISNIERYYIPLNTELSLTSNVGQFYVGSTSYDTRVHTAPACIRPLKRDSAMCRDHEQVSHSQLLRAIDCGMVINY